MHVDMIMHSTVQLSTCSAVQYMYMQCSTVCARVMSFPYNNIITIMLANSASGRKFLQFFLMSLSVWIALILRVIRLFGTGVMRQWNLSICIRLGTHANALQLEIGLHSTRNVD